MTLKLCVNKDAENRTDDEIDQDWEYYDEVEARHIYNRVCNMSRPARERLISLLKRDGYV